MPTHSRTFSVFVSSTFTDLKVERDALQRRVFPRIAALCEKAGCRFHAIDLRWGVSEEAGLDQRTGRICLNELHRCQRVTPRPNFILLLGNRYGRPLLPEEIPAEEFELIIRGAREQPDLNCSRISEWYARDDNADPPVYYLKPRTGEFIALDVWSAKIERPIRQALLTIVERLGFTQEQRMKYDQSLTEREVFAGALDSRIPDASTHAFAYFRDCEELDAMTVSTGDSRAEIGSFVDLVDSEEHLRIDEDSRRRVRMLKTAVESKLGRGHARHYTARWATSTVTYDHVDRLCEDVLEDLTRIIEAEIRELATQSDFDDEIQAHREFAEEQGNHERFEGRQRLLDQVASYVSDFTLKYPLVVIGQSGTGKSALIARTALAARGMMPSALHVLRFIGATPASVDGRQLLFGLCQELGRAIGSEAAPSREYRDLVSQFRQLLATATADKPAVVFLCRFSVKWRECVLR